MDQSLEFLHYILPLLHILAAIAFLIKVVIVFRTKGLDFPAVIISFFRIYSKSEKYMSNNKVRQQFIVLNNYINYYLYAWALITLIVFLVYQNQY